MLLLLLNGCASKETQIKQDLIRKWKFLSLELENSEINPDPNSGSFDGVYIHLIIEPITKDSIVFDQLVQKKYFGVLGRGGDGFAGFYQIFKEKFPQIMPSHENLPEKYITLKHEGDILIISENEKDQIRYYLWLIRWK